MQSLERVSSPLAGAMPTPIPKQILEKYFVHDEIGMGGYGQVRLVRERETSMKYAMKKIRKDAKLLQDIMRGIIHPHFVGLKERVRADYVWYVMSEFMEGGDLSHVLARRQVLPENLAKFYFYQVVLAVDHLHRRVGMAHENLKPQNILLASASEDYCLVKVTDEAVSRVDLGRRGPKQRETGVYEPPEVKKYGLSTYPRRADMWSLGAILFHCLTGLAPEIRGDLKPQHFPAAASVSRLPRNLLQRLMVAFVCDRLEADRALGHKWLQDDEMQRKVAIVTKTPVSHDGPGDKGATFQLVENSSTRAKGRHEYASEIQLCRRRWMRIVEMGVAGDSNLH